MTFKKRLLPRAEKGRSAHRCTFESAESFSDREAEEGTESLEPPVPVQPINNRKRKGLLLSSRKSDASLAKSCKAQSSVPSKVLTGAECDPQRYALLDKSFRSQGERLDNKADPHLEAFVKERMIGKGLIQPESTNTGTNTTGNFVIASDAPQTADYKELLELAQKREAQLFQIPEALRVEDKGEEEVDKMGWLTGLVEFPLSIEDKLKSIEETEREKRLLLKQRMRMGNGDISISSISTTSKVAPSRADNTCTTAVEALLRNKPGTSNKTTRDPTNIETTSSHLPGANLVRTAFGQRFQTFELRKTACATDDSVMDRFRKRMRRM